MSEKNESGTLDGLSGDQLQNTVQNIVRDPAFGRLLAEMQGKSPGEATDIPPITPEMMAKLPQMMAALSPLVGGMRQEKEKEEKGEKGEKKPDGDGHKDTKSEAEKRKKLLAALRPYLSDGRREAMDSILKVTEMTDLLGGFHLPGSKS